jgi:hypothetical protein
MRPVDQLVFPDPEKGIRGDCFRSCVASILNLPAREVPHFVQEDNYWASLENWLEPMGLSAIDVTLASGVSISGPLQPLYCVLTGKSPRAGEAGRLRHCVVAKRDLCGEFEIVHDPHPSRDGLAGNPERAMFFVKAFRPHRVMVCGVDCHPGDSVCNNYCNKAPQKGPMAKEPPPGPDAA